MADVISFAGSPKPEQVNAVNAICEAARALFRMIDAHCPADSYTTKQALLKLQETLMWSNLAVVSGGEDEGE